MSLPGGTTDHSGSLPYGPGETRTAPDEVLIARFQEGEEAAFNELVRRYKDPLTNFAFRFLGDRDDCLDVVQETFVRVYRNKHSFKPIARFSTWIYTITTNLCRTALRRKRIRTMLRLHGPDGEGPGDLVDESAKTDEGADAALKAERIQKALLTLPPKYREVVVLREIEQLSYEEIAQVTRMNIGTVKSRINRARARLQEQLKDLLDD
jgi:RNA polymerase sigma-70 factor (ECF subfamily)